MTIKKVTILEFAPTADEIWCISQHNRDGYVRYDAEEGLLSILDTAHDAKPRPEIITTYAGGKATNVARVLDKLLADEDELQAELITFLPPPPDGPLQELELGDARGVSLRPSTAAGIYVQCLQIAGLHKVRPRFEVVDGLEESATMQTTRRCIEITLKEGGGTLNFSPRIVWSQEAAAAVTSRVAEVAQDADLVVLAGAPPRWEFRPDSNLRPLNLYAKVIDALGPDCQVSLDTRGRYLYECLIAQRTPAFALMNTEEFVELSELLGNLGETDAFGTLLVHDERGCWVWNGKLPGEEDPFSQAEYFPAIDVPNVYSTIGAGDAMHAGFLKEWICSECAEERLRSSVVYGQVVAAVAVSNEKATHGVNARAVEDLFLRIWRGMDGFQPT